MKNRTNEHGLWNGLRVKFVDSQPWPGRTDMEVLTMIAIPAENAFKATFTGIRGIPNKDLITTFKRIAELECFPQIVESDSGREISPELRMQVAYATALVVRGSLFMRLKGKGIASYKKELDQHFKAKGFKKTASRKLHRDQKPTACQLRMIKHAGFAPPASRADADKLIIEHNIPYVNPKGQLPGPTKADLAQDRRDMMQDAWVVLSLLQDPIVAEHCGNLDRVPMRDLEALVPQLDAQYKNWTNPSQLMEVGLYIRSLLPKA